ncbi:MAG: DUF4065 domain-containing protein [Gammaproteobacteria bacterium]|nr:DUF4065 domain-containing protein [Gammaproteobacteria bacterium]
MEKHRNPYHPVAVANYFVCLGKQEKVSISVLKLVKLVHMAHGWHLALCDEPLLDEAVEAWTFGPMIPSVYHTFKKWENKPIKGVEKILNEENPSEWVLPSIHEQDEQLLTLLNHVWSIYKKFTTHELSLLAHREGSAWQEAQKVYKGRALRNRHIPDSIIQEEFKQLNLLSQQLALKTADR